FVVHLFLPSPTDRTNTSAGRGHARGRAVPAFQRGRSALCQARDRCLTVSPVATTSAYGQIGFCLLRLATDPWCLTNFPDASRPTVVPLRISPLSQTPSFKMS